MLEWAAQAQAALARGPTALVTILATEGSAPREAGTRMVVTAAAAFGTIGGGALEHRAIDQARAALAHAPGLWRVQDYPLGPLLGQCCGGRVRLLIERLESDAGAWLTEVRQGRTLVTRFTSERAGREVSDEALPPSAVQARGATPGEGAVLVDRLGRPRRPVLLFGAGHVGRAIADAAAGLPLSLAWFDTRPEAAETPGVAWVEEPELEACAAAAPSGAAILILTHDHGVDYRLVCAALESPAAFIGLIGSRTKRTRFFSRLEADGFDPAARARVTCPIGLVQVPGKEPQVIAIATLAQLLALPGPPA